MTCPLMKRGLGREHRPWMLQQLLRGREYSSYSVAHEGQLVMHSDNEASLSCLDYAHINSKQVSFYHPTAMLALLQRSYYGMQPLQWPLF